MPVRAPQIPGAMIRGKRRERKCLGRVLTILTTKVGTVV